MKKSFPLIILFLFAAVGAGAQVDYGHFRQGNITRIFNLTAKVQIAPSDDSETVTILAIGTEVLVEKEFEFMKTERGYKAAWYRVSFTLNNKRETGCIWGGNLAAVALPTGAAGEFFLYGLSEFRKNDGFFALARIIRNGEVKTELRLPAVSFSEDGRYDYSLKGETLGNRGFSGLNNIFRISSYYAACGYPNINALFFWSGGNLKLATEARNVYDAGLIALETELIFPDQSGGKADRLMLIERLEEYEDESLLRRKITRRQLKWDGKDLVE